ncbi:GNAT family N-acetyltransferase [Acetivibrio cellulolyticus]|uniref:GNAT family N-acetyltransferase n=1 Tax=Acetivibrio cellulolyticus TaxID=35830 RepID=UPI0001E2C1EF|nr:GNAT family N-acetyltransferase [Acetivibrio cellulolyticus]
MIRWSSLITKQIKDIVCEFLKGFTTEIRFEKATINDIEVLIDVRNKSFYADYTKYGECSGYNMSKEDMTDSILNRISYKIICNNQVVGNIGIRDNQDDTYYLGCLCVIPDYENKGIGEGVIRFIESEFPNATV